MRHIHLDFPHRELEEHLCEDGADFRFGHVQAVDRQNRHVVFALLVRARFSSELGRCCSRMTMNGLLISLSSEITRSSASSYSSRGMSVMLPSVVTTSPMVECSVMTFGCPSPPPY